jgi:hypothetical protein
LPITGFLIWYGRKFKKKKGKKGDDTGTGTVEKAADKPAVKARPRVITKEQEPVLAASARIDQSYN